MKKGWVRGWALRDPITGRWLGSNLSRGDRWVEGFRDAAFFKYNGAPPSWPDYRYFVMKEIPATFENFIEVKPSPLDTTGEIMYMRWVSICAPINDRRWRLYNVFRNEDS